MMHNITDSRILAYIQSGEKSDPELEALLQNDQYLFSRYLLLLTMEKSPDSAPPLFSAQSAIREFILKLRNKTVELLDASGKILRPVEIPEANVSLSSSETISVYNLLLPPDIKLKIGFHPVKQNVEYLMRISFELEEEGFTAFCLNEEKNPLDEINLSEQNIFDYKFSHGNYCFQLQKNNILIAEFRLAVDDQPDNS